MIPFATRPAQPMYCRFTPAVAAPCLACPVSSSADRHPPTPRPAGRVVQPGRGVFPDLAHRRGLVPLGAAQQPLGLTRCPVARLLGGRPSVPRRQVAGQRGHVLPRLQPRLRPREARPQQSHQGRPLPRRLADPYPGSGSRLVLICPHKHMIPRRLRSSHGNHPTQTSLQLKTQLDAAVLEGRHPKVMAGPGEAGSRLRRPGGGPAGSGALTRIPHGSKRGETPGLLGPRRRSAPARRRGSSLLKAGQEPCARDPDRTPRLLAACQVPGFPGRCSLADFGLCARHISGLTYQPGSTPLYTDILPGTTTKR